jgi:hypothetical protein
MKDIKHLIYTNTPGWIIDGLYLICNPKTNWVIWNRLDSYIWVHIYFEIKQNILSLIITNR